MGSSTPKQTPEASTDAAKNSAISPFITHLADSVPEKTQDVNDQGNDGKKGRL